MTTFRYLAASAVVAAFSLCSAAQVNQPNVPPSGVNASQNSTSKTGQDPRGSMNSGDAMGTTSKTMGSHGMMSDAEFIRKTIKGNQSEIDAGNLAVKNGGSEDVKKFGQKMVDDHTAMLNDITKVGQDLNVKGSNTPSAKDKAMMAKMSAMTGTAFDKAYVKDMVKDHKKDLAELTSEAKKASNPEVKEAAAKALPIVQGHLEMIEGIEKNMMSSPGATK